jgi:hypothetical protein
VTQFPIREGRYRRALAKAAVLATIGFVMAESHRRGAIGWLSLPVDRSGGLGYEIGEISRSCYPICPSAITIAIPFRHCRCSCSSSPHQWCVTKSRNLLGSILASTSSPLGELSGATRSGAAWWLGSPASG